MAGEGFSEDFDMSNGEDFGEGFLLYGFSGGEIIFLW